MEAEFGPGLLAAPLTLATNGPPTRPLPSSSLVSLQECHTSPGLLAMACDAGPTACLSPTGPASMTEALLTQGGEPESLLPTSSPAKAEALLTQGVSQKAFCL